MITAVEFLHAALSLHFTQEQEMQFIGLFQQALEMEKEQMWDYIKATYVNGENSLIFHQKEFEQYYNDTYKKD